MTEAILFLQLVDVPAYPAGTIVEVFPADRKDKLCGGDISTFLPIMVTTAKYTFEELRRLKLTHGVNFTNIGISEPTMTARRDVCLNMLRSQVKRLVIMPTQVIAPKFHKIVDIDKAGVLFETGFKYPAPEADLYEDEILKER